MKSGIFKLFHNTILKQNQENYSVTTVLKVKQQALGWPDWFVDGKTKQLYIQQYHDKEGIMFDYNRIEKNPGLRSLVKLMLNSFWGKVRSAYQSDPKQRT
jgi:hypothetical protein